MEDVAVELLLKISGTVGQPGEDIQRLTMKVTTVTL